MLTVLPETASAAAAASSARNAIVMGDATASGGAAAGLPQELVPLPRDSCVPLSRAGATASAPRVSSLSQVRCEQKPSVSRALAFTPPKLRNAVEHENPAHRTRTTFVVGASFYLGSTYFRK